MNDWTNEQYETKGQLLKDEMKKTLRKLSLIPKYRRNKFGDKLVGR